MYIESEESRRLMAENWQNICHGHDPEPGEAWNYSKFQVAKCILQQTWETIKEQGFKHLLYKIKCQRNRSLIYDKVAKFENDDSELHYQCKNDFTGKRIAVYTAIFGGYDEIIEPKYKSPVCDYFIFTDMEVPADSIWKKIDIATLPETAGMDAYHKSKYVKVLPHLLFPDYDYSIWVDGCTEIFADLAPLIDRLDGKFMGAFDHLHRDCIATEANYLRYLSKAPYNLIYRQVGDYFKAGFPKHFGMWEMTVIVRAHNHDTCKKVMNDWWTEICRYSMRDQLSIPYVLWKNGLAYTDVCIFGPNRKFNPRLRFLPHTKTHIYK